MTAPEFEFSCTIYLYKKKHLILQLPTSEMSEIFFVLHIFVLMSCGIFICQNLKITVHFYSFNLKL